MGKILKLLLTVAIIGGAVAVVYGFITKKNDVGPGFTLIEAELGDITEKALAVGKIDPREQFQVKSKISGIVSRCFVEVGDQVASGDALFEIAPDPTPQELLNVDHRLRSAQTRFDKAAADFERGRQLHRDGLLSKGDIDTLEDWDFWIRLSALAPFEHLAQQTVQVNWRNGLVQPLRE